MTGILSRIALWRFGMAKAKKWGIEHEAGLALIGCIGFGMERESGRGTAMRSGMVDLRERTAVVREVTRVI